MASAGWLGVASAGWLGVASAGWLGVASAGWLGVASAGWLGVAIVLAGWEWQVMSGCLAVHSSSNNQLETEYLLETE